MNKFDRIVNKKTKELIEKNQIFNHANEGTIKKLKIISRAIVREEMRGLKPNNDPKSLYSKTWKATEKYEDYMK